MTKELNWIDYAYNMELRSAIRKRMEEGTQTKEDMRIVLDSLDNITTEMDYLEKMHDFISDKVWELARYVTVNDDFKHRKDQGRLPTMANHWRWGWWYDCMAYTPELVELVCQSLCGAAFDAGRSSK